MPNPEQENGPFVDSDAESFLDGDGVPILDPGQLFVDSNYAVRVNAWCSAAGVTLGVRTRQIRTSDGNMVVSADQLVLTSARALNTLDLRLAAGWVLGIQAFPIVGTPTGAQVFVQFSLIYGAGAAAIVIGTIGQGYCSANMPACWPGMPIASPLDGPGALLVISGTTPAAGADVVETMPAGARRELLSFRARLTASATVANRFATLLIDDGTANADFEGGVLATPQTAGQVARWTWGDGLNAQVNQSGFNGALLNRGFLLPGHRISTSTAGIQVGDQWDQVKYRLREWLTCD